MKIGIISFAHGHAYSYASVVHQHPKAELAWISDVDTARGEQAAARFGAGYVRDYQQLLTKDVDAVIICSENAHHKEAVLASAQANKPILCEKPISTNVADARQMVDACREAGVQLQTAFPCRFTMAAQRTKEIIEAGELGRIIAMNGTNRGRNPGGWFIEHELSGGGAVLDHTVHILDIMRWFTGSEVKEVFAEVDTRFGTPGIDDCGLLTLEFENGVIAAHDPSWSRPQSFPRWGDVTLEVVGTGGVTRMDAFGQHATHYRGGEGGVQYRDWSDSMDQAMVADFIEAVIANRPVSVTGEDGLRAMEVALAAYESAQTGRPVRVKHG